jgi:hypothetical protein
MTVPPALRRDLSRLDRWSPNDRATVHVVQGASCPYFPGDPVNAHVLVDGQRPGWDSPNNERCDIQCCSVPRVGVGGDSGLHGFEGALQIVQVPTNHRDAWWYLVPAPIEFHGHTPSQALIQPECRVSAGVGAQGGPTPYRRADLPAGEPRLFMNANAGRSAQRRWDMGPVKVGTDDTAWAMLRMLVRLSTGGDGLMEAYRDDLIAEDVPVVRVLGATTIEARDPWLKAPLYMNAGQSGRRELRWAGLRWYNGLPARRVAGGPSPPPPPAGDTTAPLITLRLPVPGQGYPVDAIPYDFDVAPDPAGVTDVWVGYVGPNASGVLVEDSDHGTAAGTYRGTFDGRLLNLKAPNPVRFYVVAKDGLGNDLPRKGFEIGVLPVEPEPEPEPEPPPPFDFAPLREDLVIAHKRLETIITRTYKDEAALDRALGEADGRVQRALDRLPSED